MAVKRDGAVAPGIVSVPADFRSARIINADNIPKQIALEVVSGRRTGFRGVHHTDDTGLVIQVNLFFGTASFSVVLTRLTLANQSSGLVITECVAVTRQHSCNNGRGI